MLKHIRYTHVILGTLAIVMLAGGAYLYFHSRHENNATQKTPSETINYDPPTKEEAQAGNDQKQANDKKENAETVTSKANIVITDSSQYVETIEVRAYISNTAENGGTCTTTLTKAGFTSVVKTTQAFSDATTTQCGAIDIPRSAFGSSGTWSGVIQYHSPTHDGTSNPFKVIVQ